MKNEHIPWVHRVRLFQKCAILIGASFLLIMVFAVFVAYNRRSGSTGMDPAKIQLDRYRHQTESTKQ